MKRICHFTLRAGAQVTELRTRRKIGITNNPQQETTHYGWQEGASFYFKATGDTYRANSSDVANVEWGALLRAA